MDIYELKDSDASKWSLPFPKETQKILSKDNNLSVESWLILRISNKIQRFIKDQSKYLHQIRLSCSPFTNSKWIFVTANKYFDITLISNNI